MEKIENIIDLRVKLLHNRILERKLECVDICRGICTESHFKSILRGNRFADKILLDAFMQRADIPTEQYECIVSRQEYNIVRKIDDIIEAIDSNSFCESEKLLLEYEILTEKRNILYTQLEKLLEGISCYCVETDDKYNEAIKLFLYAIKMTRQDYLNAQTLLNNSVSYVELGLHIMIFISKVKLNRDINAKQYIHHEIDLWNQHYAGVCSSEKCGLLCNWAVYICDVCERNQMYSEIEDISGKALKLLVSTHRTYAIRELLDMWAKYANHNDVDEAKAMSEYIKDIYIEFDIEKESIAWCVPFAVNEIYPIDDMVRTRRKQVGMSQEQLASGICSSKTISNLERGRYAPKPREKKKILEQLGIKYSEYGVIDSQDIELHNEVIEWDNALNEYDYEICKNKYDEFLDKLENTEVNRQYILFKRIANENARCGRSDEETITDYINALHMTCKAWNNNEEWIYSGTEINILYNIGDLMFKKGNIKKAQQICDTILGFYDRQHIHTRHFMSGYALVETVYASWFGTLGQLEKAYNMSKNNIKRELFYGGNSLVAIRLYDTGWDIQEMNQKQTQESIRYMKYAYALALLVNKPIAKALENDITLQ